MKEEEARLEAESGGVNEARRRQQTKRKTTGTARISGAMKYRRNWPLGKAG